VEFSGGDQNYLAEMCHAILEQGGATLAAHVIFAIRNRVPFHIAFGPTRADGTSFVEYLRIDPYPSGV